MMKRRKVRTYDKEFKLNAIKLYLTSGRPYEEISSELGIPVGTLVTWVKGHAKEGSEAFPGKGHVKPSDVELLNLRKELAMVREERDILKKALGIFSSQRK
jgi:transposase-like protein